MLHAHFQVILVSHIQPLSFSCFVCCFSIITWILKFRVAIWMEKGGGIWFSHLAWHKLQVRTAFRFAIPVALLLTCVYAILNMALFMCYSTAWTGLFPRGSPKEPAGFFFFVDFGMLCRTGHMAARPRVYYGVYFLFWWDFRRNIKHYGELQRIMKILTV